MKEKVTRVIDKFKLLADNGDAEAQYVLWIMYTKRDYGDSYEAVKYSKMAADNGIIEAQRLMGDLYSKGVYDVLEQNYGETIKYYKMAADSGDAEAQFKLAELYDHEYHEYDYSTEKWILKYPQNRRKAFKYYKMAAENGVGYALDIVMRAYLEKGYYEGFEKYYHIAMNTGDLDIMNSAQFKCYLMNEKKQKNKRK